MKKIINLSLKQLYYKCKPYKDNIRINTDFKIKTKNGYQSFFGVMKVNEHKGIKFTFNNNTSIICTLNHRFMLYDYPQIADELFEDDYIHDLKIIKKEYVYCDYFFDILNVENGNTFISNGINNHNCNLIVVDECIEYNTMITIKDKKTNKIFNTSIGEFYDKYFRTNN